jgi:hypothetical protein
MCWSVLFPKKKNSCIALRNAALPGRVAVSSILRLVFETRALCSLGKDGNADEKDHSSSSLVVTCDASVDDGCRTEGLGVAGLEEEPRIEKGSEAGALGGTVKAEDRGGCGVLLDEPEGAELNDEKALYPGGGVEVDDTGPRALEFCVTEERSAGPGMSVLVSVGR